MEREPCKDLVSFSNTGEPLNPCKRDTKEGYIQIKHVQTEENIKKNVFLELKMDFILLGCFPCCYDHIFK